MSSLNLQAPWDEVKEKLKEINVELTDQDLDYTPGKEDELFSKLQDKLGKSKEDIKVWIESVSYTSGMAG